jgi:hypothetical protein
LASYKSRVIILSEMGKRKGRVMGKTDNMPMWVYLAFSSIKTRKRALLLIWACVVFSIYCIPWPLFITSQDWVVKIFLIEDWGWFAIMVPFTFWYWISLRWIDNNSGWDETG